MCTARSIGARFVLSSIRSSQALPVRLLSSKQQESRKVDKSLLSQLRKETGFGFAKCMESLQLFNNDYNEAITWLKAEAEKQGWEKATKLQGRTASEGLIGVLVDGNFGAMVEVNCETDFVARNELFVDLVSKVTSAAMVKRKKIVEQNQKINAFAGELEHLREVIPEYKLKNELIQDGDGETVADTVARTIGKLGENIKINKAIAMTTETRNVIGSYVHGPFVTSLGGCSLGRYGGIVAVKPKQGNSDMDSVQRLANRLAQHVVGMNPSVIEEVGSDNEAVKDGEANNVLLEQEYLLDDSVIVKDLLNTEGVEVVDFVRYECGA
ncbi:hypothetical protein ACROYT_G021722 [Oculina patagonica]